MLIRAVFAALLLLTLPARANVTLHNFDGIDTDLLHQVSKFDINGDFIDAHSGSILQVGTCPSCDFYLYGDRWGPGYAYVSASSAYGGISIYHSTDLTNWENLGSLFDPNSGTWQSDCQPFFGTQACIWPRMIYNAGTGKYVLWYFMSVTTSNYAVFVCDTPTSGCVRQADPTLAQPAPIGPGGIMVDDDGTAYLVYTVISGGNHTFYIDKLNSAYTDYAGSGASVHVTSDTNVEAPMLFKKGSNYYVIGGATCAFCGTGTDTRYYTTTAANPLSGWGTSTQINANSCLGQPASVSKLTTATGDIYFYSVDQYRGLAEEAVANLFQQVLAFSGATISSYTCDATVTITGLTANPPAPGRTPDQTDETSQFNEYCDITSSLWRAQQFVPTKASLGTVALTIGKGNISTCTPGGSTCDPPNGDFMVGIYAVDGSGNPTGAALASQTITGSTLSWAPQRRMVSLVATLTPSTTYAIQMKGSNTTGGFCYTFGYGSPYAGGVVKNTTNGGSSWATSTGESAKFSTFEPVVVVSMPISASPVLH